VASSANANQPVVLLERDAELGRLAGDLVQARAGNGRTVLICGPAGIGKTALLGRVQHRARAEGVLVLRARGVELEQDFAFGVVRQLLERVVLGLEAVQRSRLLSGPARAAGVLLGASDLPAVDSEHRASVVLHGLYALVVNLAERTPVVVLVDDAHWGDRPSLRWLSYLAGRLDGLRVLEVVATRAGDPTATDPSLAAITAEPGTRIAAIEPLTPTASAVLVERELGASPAAEFNAACFAATGGNPFFPGELCRALQAARILPTAEGAVRIADQGPASVARSVLLRTAGLSPSAAELARSLAIFGAEAELRHAAALAALDDATAADAAAQLGNAQIVVSGRRVSFAHPIVRSSIYADIPSTRRAAAHDRAARLLADDGASAERVSAHLLVAIPAGDPWVVSVLEQAATGALDRGAPDSAVTYLRRALAEPAPEAARQRVLAQLGWAEYLAHDRTAAVTHLIEAMGATPATEDAATLALRTSRVLVIAGVDRSAEAVEILDRALSGLPEATPQARMQTRSGAACCRRPQALD
jgi:hypothetical protein